MNVDVIPQVRLTDRIRSLGLHIPYLHFSSSHFRNQHSIVFVGAMFNHVFNGNMNGHDLVILIGMSTLKGFSSPG